MSLIIVYVIGNNIFYLSAYADLPDEINKIQNCKNSKIIDNQCFTNVSFKPFGEITKNDIVSLKSHIRLNISLTFQKRHLKVKRNFRF